MRHDDDIVSEEITACSAEVDAELSATLVGRHLQARGGVRWADVVQVDRLGRRTRVIRGVWPARSEAAPGDPQELGPVGSDVRSPARL